MKTINGLGLGLRREFLQHIDSEGFLPDWWEIAPENWMDMPYHHREKFEEVTALRPVVAHGLSLSIGSYGPLDVAFLKKMKAFLDRYHIEHYSDHLSFTSLMGHQTYELLPLAMTPQNVVHIASRIQQVSEIMERQLILENATYYYVPEATLREADFINEIMHRANAKLLLDVNNAYVNAKNHGFSPREFIDALDLSHAAYIHVAGHYHDEELGMIIDSHGTSVHEDVWHLLGETLQKADLPVMIERDNYIPSYAQMQAEYNTLESVVQGAKHARV
ncbi:MAG: DUF692 domain-containing protein [Campylobacterales bacterium]|nr:DUF692 domain-containing protein [Campylobacterales bacterium]